MQPITQANVMSVLIDNRRRLAAELAGVNLRIAILLGDREEAYWQLKEMMAQVEARRAWAHECKAKERARG